MLVGFLGTKLKGHVMLSRRGLLLCGGESGMTCLVASLKGYCYICLRSKLGAEDRNAGIEHLQKIRSLPLSTLRLVRLPKSEVA
jgi:hypothetical protein